jgi:RNA-binding protein YlmH
MLRARVGHGSRRIAIPRAFLWVKLQEIMDKAGYARTRQSRRSRRKTGSLRVYAVASFNFNFSRPVMSSSSVAKPCI